MQKKEKKLPNRTDIPIDIPTDKVTIDGKTYPAYGFKLTTTTFPEDFYNRLSKPITYIRETTYNPTTHNEPTFINPNADANLTPIFKERAKNLLIGTHPTREFAGEKFPKNVYVQCNRCASKIQYISDFFTHGIEYHGIPIQQMVTVFGQILDKIDAIQ